MTDKNKNDYENHEELESYDEDQFEEDFDEYDDEVEDYREFILTLEDDTEIKCLVISEFFVEDQGYIALLPLEDDEPGDILLYRTNYKEDDTFDISMIETEEEFEIASDAYYENVGITDFEFLNHHDCDCEECSHEHEHDHCDCEECSHEHEHDHCDCEECSHEHNHHDCDCEECSHEHEHDHCDCEECSHDDEN